jgi:D-glycero-D-manno-heptose 1,7-bisphosphate phosphatase
VKPSDRPTVFLDRDGTLNREIGFVTSPEQVDVLPGVPDAVRRLHDAGYRLVVVTNQSGIARGLYSQRDLAAVHAKMHAAFGGVIDAWLHCPHHPDGAFGYGGACACRKPAAGLLQQAHELLGVTWDGGMLIGDSARDLAMTRGLPLLKVLVHSGKPASPELATLRELGIVPDHEAADLPAAVDWLLGR